MSHTQASLQEIIDGLPGEDSHWVRPNSLQNAIYNLIPRKAEISVQGNVDETTIDAISTFYETDTNGSILLEETHHLGQVFSQPSPGRLQYDGTVAMRTSISCSLSVISANSNQNIYFRLALNGMTIPSSEGRHKIASNGDLVFLYLQCLLPNHIEQGDYISLFVANFTSSSNLTVVNINLRTVLDIH